MKLYLVYTSSKGGKDILTIGRNMLATINNVNYWAKLTSSRITFKVYEVETEKVIDLDTKGKMIYKTKGTKEE